MYLTYDDRPSSDSITEASILQGSKELGEGEEALDEPGSEPYVAGRYACIFDCLVDEGKYDGQGYRLGQAAEA